MKRIAKPNQLTDLTPITGAKDEAPLLVSEVSIQRLIDSCLLTLSREVRNLSIASTRGKLTANDARDLRDHTKLLFELKDREREALKGLTDEQIEQLVEQAKKEKEQNDISTTSGTDKPV